MVSSTAVPLQFSSFNLTFFCVRTADNEKVRELENETEDLVKSGQAEKNRDITLQDANANRSNVVLGSSHVRIGIARMNE